MELSNDWHKRTNVRLVDILSDILKELRPPKVPKPTHGYTIAEKAPEVVTAPGVYFPAEKGKVIPLESRQAGGTVAPTRTLQQILEKLASYIPHPIPMAAGQSTAARERVEGLRENKFDAAIGSTEPKPLVSRQAGGEVDPTPTPQNQVENLSTYAPSFPSLRKPLSTVQMQPTANPPTSPPKGFGLRPDGTPKGTGFLGPLPASEGKTSTEISIGVNIGGKEVQIPTLIPTLTQDEVNYLLGGGKPTDAIVGKAVEYAKSRMAKGLSPFAQEGEQTSIITSPEVGSTVPLSPRQDGGEVNPSTNLPDFRLMDTYQFNKAAEKSGLQGMGAYEASAARIRAAPTTSAIPPVKAANPKETRTSVSPTPSLESYAPRAKPDLTPTPPFRPMFPDLYERLKASSGFPGTTPLFSRAPGGAVSPDPLEGLSEEERKRRAALLKTAFPAESLASSHVPTTGAGGPLVSYATTEPAEEKPIDMVPNASGMFEAKTTLPKTEPVKQIEGGLSGTLSEFKPEILPSGETRYTLPGTEGTAMAGPERFFVGGKEVPKGTPGAVSGDEAARQRILKEVSRKSPEIEAMERWQTPGYKEAQLAEAQKVSPLTINPYTNRVSGTVAVVPGFERSYDEAHPEEHFMDMARAENRPAIDTIQKSLEENKRMADGFGLSMDPKTARVQQAEAIRNVPILTQQLAEITTRSEALAARGGSRITPPGLPAGKSMTPEQLAKGAVEEDLKNKGIYREATNREILNEMAETKTKTPEQLAASAVVEDLKKQGIDRKPTPTEVLQKQAEIKGEGQTGFKTKEEAITDAKALYEKMGNPPGWVPSAKMGVGNKWVPTVLPPNIASVSIGAISSPEMTNALELQAKMYLRGGEPPKFTGMGGSVAQIEFYKVVGRLAKEQGMTDKMILSNEMILKGERQASAGLIKLRENSGAFEGMVDRNITLMTNISKNLPRTQIPVLNGVLRTGQIKLLSDPNAIKLYNAVQTVVTEYARMMGSMGMGTAVIQNEQRAIANKFIEAGFTHDALVEVSKFLKSEMQNKIDALDSSVKQSVGAIPSLPGEAPSTRPFGTNRPHAAEFGGNPPGGGEERKTIGDKSYIKRNGKWYEE
jgi:hypothetical protein